LGDAVEDERAGELPAACDDAAEDDPADERPQKEVARGDAQEEDWQADEYLQTVARGYRQALDF
jgi:hypothetical protein